MSDNRICPHCKCSKNLANPSGYCNHIHYPEACHICDRKENGPSVEELQAELKSRDVECAVMRMAIVSLPIESGVGVEIKVTENGDYWMIPYKNIKRLKSSLSKNTKEV